MTWPAAVIAGAFLFLVGLALGVRRCPEVGEVAYREDDDGIAPPDPWPVGLAGCGHCDALPGQPHRLGGRG